MSAPIRITALSYWLASLELRSLLQLSKVRVSYGQLAFLDSLADDIAI